MQAGIGCHGTECKTHCNTLQGWGGDGGGGVKGKGTDGGNRNRHKTAWKEKKLCPNCNEEVVHDPADCFSFEANKDKRPKGWGTKCGN